MSNEPVKPMGGTDLQDYTSLSRAPEMSYLQKQALPRRKRQRGAAPKTSIYQKLATFVASDYVRWIKQYVENRLGPRAKFQTYETPAEDDGVYPLTDEGGEVRVAIAGDWGTGTDEAYRVAKLMKARDPHFTIHLGDVYFVGDAAEVNENFLGQANPRHDYTPCNWPKGSKGAFALNGNHEMYARGKGYFDLMLPALGMACGPKGRPQKASFFCLENEHWRVIALDTGYNAIGWPGLELLIQPDCRLPDPLIDWLKNVLRQKDDKRGIVLLSHHQYYSRFDNWYAKPAEQLAAFIDRPVLWLWGHEHRLAIYGQHKFGAGVTAYGRCIGHGGMPVDLPDEVKHAEVKAEFTDDRLYHNDEGLRVGVNGFAALTFAGETLTIDYEDVFGRTIYSEVWLTDANGGLARGNARAMAAAP